MSKFMNVAIGCAQESTMLYQLGACIVEGNKVVSVGCNTDRSSINLRVRGLELRQCMKSSNNKLLCASMHAEIAALSRYIGKKQRFERCERGLSAKAKEQY